MNLHINIPPDIGERTGSTSLRLTLKQAVRSLCRLKTFHAKALIAVLFGVLFFPSTTFAANLSYLKENTPDFVDKIQSEYGEMINIAALLHDYDEKLILAVIVVESEGNHTAQSNRGARGLMQLMPQTAKAMGAKDPNDPFQNILAGTKYLKQLESSYGFNSPQEALVAYNMGPSRAKRWLSQYSPEDYGYVAKVMYVYDLLNSKEEKTKNVAAGTTTELSLATIRSLEEKKIDTAAKSILTKPHALSLAQLPLTLPVTRRIETQSGK